VRHAATTRTLVPSPTPPCPAPLCTPVSCTRLPPRLLPRLPPIRTAPPQDGVTTSGVSVAFTVLACDAGPVLVQEHVAVGGDESAPQLLDRLFKRGAQLLVQNINRCACACVRACVRARGPCRRSCTHTHRAWRARGCSCASYLSLARAGLCGAQGVERRSSAHGAAAGPQPGDACRQGERCSARVPSLARRHVW
jgi:hypothetical protein